MQAWLSLCGDSFSHESIHNFSLGDASLRGCPQRVINLDQGLWLKRLFIANILRNHLSS